MQKCTQGRHKWRKTWIDDIKEALHATQEGGWRNKDSASLLLPPIWQPYNRNNGWRKAETDTKKSHYISTPNPDNLQNIVLVLQPLGALKEWQTHQDNLKQGPLTELQVNTQPYVQIWDMGGLGISTIISVLNSAFCDWHWTQNVMFV